MIFGGSMTPSGVVSLKVLRRGPGGSWSATPMKELSLREIARHGLPRLGLKREVNAWRLRNLPNLWRGLWRVIVARLFGLRGAYGSLSLAVIRGDGRILDYGLASLRLVTTAGVNYLVDALQGTVEPENLRFHGFGTGTNAEAAGDTALQTEETTQYATDNTRPTGSQAEGGGANVYRTVATYSPDSGGTRPITEHGIFSQAATGGGTLLDRSVFSPVNLVAGSDSLQATFDFTLPSGGA